MGRRLKNNFATVILDVLWNLEITGQFLRPVLLADAAVLLPRLTNDAYTKNMASLRKNAVRFLYQFLQVECHKLEHCIFNSIITFLQENSLPTHLIWNFAIPDSEFGSILSLDLLSSSSSSRIFPLPITSI